MKIRSKRNTPEPHIPFISLADIAWQIIIFFLVGSTFARNESLNLDLPASSKQAQSQQDNTTLTIQASETSLMLNGQPLDLGDLVPKITNMIGNKPVNDPGRAVVLVARDDLTFQRNLDVMYGIQKAGGIVVIQEEK